MTKTDELLREFAKEIVPLFGSRFTEVKESEIKEVTIRLRALMDKLMPTEEEINEQAELHFDTFTDIGIWKGGAKWFRNRIKGKQ